MPLGLFGEVIIIALVFGDIFCSIASISRRQFSVAGIITGMPPIILICSVYEGHNGACMMTSSPEFRIVVSARNTPLFAQLVIRICSGANETPCCCVSLLAICFLSSVSPAVAIYLPVFFLSKDLIRPCVRAVGGS